MPVDRFYIPANGDENQDDALTCGLFWLLQRPETDLYIIANTAGNIAGALNRLKNHNANSPHLVALVNLLLQKGHHTFNNARLITGTLHPRPPVLPGGACLAIWCDDSQLQTLEGRLSNTGALCAVPWYMPHIQPWIDANGVPELKCVGGMPADDGEAGDEAVADDGAGLG